MCIRDRYLTALSDEPPTKYPAGQVAALNWLSQHGQPGAVVLSAFETGNLIPAYTNLRSYVGHGPETLDAIHKIDYARRFFRDELDNASRAALYADMRTRYVFYGVNERALRADPDSAPGWAGDFEAIYTADDYTIYRLKAG
jgi:uncharacterized membrane protein